MSEKNNPAAAGAGHRERLRNKLLSHGHGPLADYEVLELLLSLAIPRRDVKPIAKALLAKFGNFSRLVNASPAELASVPGVGTAAAAAVKIVEAAMVRTLAAAVSEKSVIANWTDLLDYLRVSLGGKKTEEFHLLYLDTKCHLVKDELQTIGTINSSPVYPREVLKRVLELGAASVIMVHNHPSGDPVPSKSDVDITKKVAESLATIDVTLHDHVIVSAAGVASFKALGLL
jgi:DNA repair protein RadC